MVKFRSVTALQATAFSCALAIATCSLGQMTISSTAPLRNENNVPRSTSFTVTFDRPVDRSTITPASFHLFGRMTGPLGGSYSFSNGDRTVTLTPARAPFAGEVVLSTLSRNIRGTDGVAIRSTGYTQQYTVRAAVSSGQFTQIASLSNRDLTGAQTRIYGTNACDLNRDGWADLCTVNEVSADLRVFLNRADGSGLVQPMMTPYTPLPFESSPNDIADFDGDGFIDVITSSANDSQVAIAFGRGDGTFRSVTEIDVGSYPRGLGLFDADGDGDFDITVACAGASRIEFIRNNGNGTFTTPVTFDGGVNGEYGMSSADMDGDGLFDLVVAGTSNQQISVLRGNGNGTFTLVPGSTRNVGGQCWVVACGDVNNDRIMDVAVANAFTSNGAILRGNGNGTLQAPQILATGGHTVATDFADIDGDGDLDWVLSSFGAGRWYLYRNNGSGIFSLAREFVAPSNPSCTAPVDMDNDGDMDLVFSDEIADVIMIMRNDGTPPSCGPDFNEDGFLDFFDYDAYVLCFETGVCPPGRTADFNGDDFTDFFDYDGYVEAFEAGC
jgi:hypothetical protein